MTDLRTAAQQALDALKMMRDRYEEYACPACDHADAAIYALKAALGCDHCNSPLYAAVKCRVCGRETEPAQEPVAWIEHEWAGTGLRKLHFEKRDPTVRDEVVNPVWTPLYTAPLNRA